MQLSVKTEQHLLPMKRNHDDDVAYFIAFCVEIYKNAHGLTGAEASRIFSEKGLLKYLSDNFEILHTQSPGWILEEIEEIAKSVSA